MQSLKDRTAVVTGSTSGIGLAIAEEMLARGANVMFNGLLDDKTRPEFMQTFDALKAKYPNQRLALSEANITDYAAVEQMMKGAAALSPSGKIDVLVNNAGVQRQASIENLSVADFDLVLKTNLAGTFYNIKAALPFMKKREGEGFSQIVNISSVHGLVPSPERAAYCAAKHGDEALKGVAAAEFAPFNIRVNNVNPAFVKTPLALAPIEAKAKQIAADTGAAPKDAYAQAEAWRLQNQGGKWIELADVAKATANLADFSDARKTGESIVLDHGLYVKGAHETPGGAAHFDKAGPLAVDQLNEAIQRAAAFKQF